VECDYNTDLFRCLDDLNAGSVTIKRCWRASRRTRSEWLGKLPILTSGERAGITIGWNRTGIEFPKQQALHNWFESQADRTPEALALTFGGAALDLCRTQPARQQLAHLLMTLGVGPDVLVGLFPRSLA